MRSPTIRKTAKIKGGGEEGRENKTTTTTIYSILSQTINTLLESSNVVVQHPGEFANQT